MPKKPSKRNGATAVENSKDSKLGGMSATYVSQRSCPPDCALLQRVVVDGEEQRPPCYALYGQTFWTTNRINKQADALGSTSLQLAETEAEAIDTLSGRNRLRLHVVGDCVNDQNAQIVSDSAMRFSDRYVQYHPDAEPGDGIHGYTHAHDRVNRASWGTVSILASCETLDQAKAAIKRGYAAAIVVPEKHKSAKAYKVGDVTIIPCPEQTKASASCMTCKLCFDDKALLARRALIAFAPDSTTAPRVKQALAQALVQIGTRG